MFAANRLGPVRPPTRGIPPGRPTGPLGADARTPTMVFNTSAMQLDHDHEGNEG